MVTFNTTFCILFVIFNVSRSSFDSTSSSLKLPFVSKASAAGYDDQNDVMLMFGGIGSSRQFTQFKNNAFIYHNSSYLPSTQNIGSGALYYFQLNDTLWMLHQQGTHFVTASTHPPYDVTIPNISIPITVDDNGCLAMTHRHIFIVGGSSPTNCAPHSDVQIYDMMSGEWKVGVPSLPANRLNMACYAANGILYAIGGDDCGQKYNSILTLNVSDAALTNISSEQWQVATATINTPSGTLSVVKDREDLILIGGSDDDDIPLKDVNIINTVTGDCYLAGTLSLGATLPACILHRDSNRLYIFGGSEPFFNRWQFINLPTSDPTANPTTDPTNSPTEFSTSDPTKSPTSNPSFTPTTNPTFEPSQRPSFTPTTTPSFVPTFKPSSAPLLQSTNITIVYVVTDHEPTENTNPTIDELAKVLIAVCATLCLTVVVALAVFAILKKKERESVKEAQILGVIANQNEQRNESSNEDTDKEDSVEDLYAVRIAENTKGTNNGEEDKKEDSAEELYEVPVVENTKAINHGEEEEGDDVSDDADAEELYDHEGLKRIEENTTTKKTPLAPTNHIELENVMDSNPAANRTVGPQPIQNTMDLVMSDDNTCITTQYH